MQLSRKFITSTSLIFVIDLEFMPRSFEAPQFHLAGALTVFDAGSLQKAAELFHIQSGAAYHLLGFEDENVGSSPGWWAANVPTYCPSKPGELSDSYLQNLAKDLPPRLVGRFDLGLSVPRRGRCLRARKREAGWGRGCGCTPSGGLRARGRSRRARTSWRQTGIGERCPILLKGARSLEVSASQQ